jgi:hypothetical protein
MKILYVNLLIIFMLQPRMWAYCAHTLIFDYSTCFKIKWDWSESRRRRKFSKIWFFSFFELKTHSHSHTHKTVVHVYLRDFSRLFHLTSFISFVWHFHIVSTMSEMENERKHLNCKMYQNTHKSWKENSMANRFVMPA